MSNSSNSNPNPATKTVGKSPRKLAESAARLPPGGSMPEPDMATKLHLARLLSEMLMSGEYEIEFPDDLIVGKFTNRVAKLEARVAELEKQLGKPATAERADTAKLAKGGK